MRRMVINNSSSQSWSRKMTSTGGVLVTIAIVIREADVSTIGVIELLTSKPETNLKILNGRHAEPSKVIVPPPIGR